MSVDVYVRTGLSITVTPQVSPTYLVGTLPVIQSGGGGGVSEGWVDTFYYPRSNPSGYATGVDASLFVRKTESGQFAPSGMTGQFVTTDKTGQYAPAGMTGQFITTAQTGQYAPAGLTGQFITTAQTGQYAPAGLTGQFISSAQTGQYAPAGMTGQFITTNMTGQFAASGATGQFITTFQTGQFAASGMTGQFVTTDKTGGFVSISQTGQFITSTQTGEFIPRGETGQAFYPRYGNPAGYLTSAGGDGGVNSLVVTGSPLSGNIVISGAGNISVLTGYAGQNIIAISGWETGQYVTTAMTGQYAPAGLTGQFVTTAQTGVFYPASNPSSYITSAQTGQFAPSGLTGQFVTTNQTGQFAPSGLTGQFISTAQTGIFVSRGETGNAFYPRYGNPDGYLTSAVGGGVTSLNVSGQNISGVISVTGIGSVNVSLSGNAILISGGGGETDINTILTSQGDLLVRNLSQATRLPITGRGAFLFSDGVDAKWLSSWQREVGFEDFIQLSSDWTISTANSASANPANPGFEVELNAPGIRYMRTNTSSSAAAVGINRGVTQIVGGDGEKWVAWRFKLLDLPTSGQDFRIAIGFGDGGSSTEHTDGAYLYCSGYTEPNWMIVTSNNATRTFQSTNSGISLGWQVAAVKIESGGETVRFYHGPRFSQLIEIGTGITTNIPTSVSRAFGLAISLRKTVGTSDIGLYADACAWDLSVTGER